MPPPVQGLYRHSIAMGYLTPHFSPWDLVRMYSSVASLLRDNGVFVVEETDRVYNILYRVGYKDFLLEKDLGDKQVVSIHLGYNIMKGCFRRAYYIIPGFKKIAVLDTKFWDLATVAAIGWIFFKEPDIIPEKTLHKTHGSGYIILYKNPRTKHDPEEYSQPPKPFSNKQ